MRNYSGNEVGETGPVLLALRVIEHAVCSATSGRKIASKGDVPPQKQARVEDGETAEAWIAADSIQMGAFEWYCDLLNLDPDVVRYKLKLRLENI